MNELALFLGFIALLVIGGAVYVIRSRKKQQQLQQQAAIAKGMVEQRQARFSVTTTHYVGENGGDARRAWEAALYHRMETDVSVFMDGDQCRGRVPEGG